jgi:alpha-D-xyloside xylohydrolase
MLSASAGRLLHPTARIVAMLLVPLGIRIYGGKDADFELYEDGGDGYSYEHGARATVHLHWDERGNALSIGDLTGRFPGMRAKHTSG